MAKLPSDMRALRNILGDLLFQFRIRGALLKRLYCVVTYYAAYLSHRLLSRTQDEARMRALVGMSRRGFAQWPAIIRFDGLALETDVMAASFMPREFLLDRMYEAEEGFAARPGETVVDVGAHNGFFSLRSARRVGARGRVISIEPHPENQRRLGANLERNGLANVALVREAVSDSEGKATLYASVLLSGGHSLVCAEDFENMPRRGIEVRTRPLDAILEEHGVSKVDVLKIDVEGAFLRVLDTAKRALASRPRVVIEVEGGGSGFDEIRRRLEPLGYAITIDGGILYARPPRSG